MASEASGKASVKAKGKRAVKAVRKRASATAVAASGKPQVTAKFPPKVPPKIKAKSKAKISPKAGAARGSSAGRTRKAVPKPRTRARARGPVPKVRPDLVGTSVTRIIAADADLHEGIAALRAACAVMAKVHDLAGHPPLRRPQGGFPGLARIIVGQQLSVASAAAIWGRTEKLVQPFTPQRLLALSDAELASAGLSGPKIRTLRAIAQACVAGLDLDGLDAVSDAHVHDALTAVSGIGPWTADIYLMFCLGRADAWAPGDLALQIAAQQAFGLKQRPDKDELLDIAERWRPWRGVAARLLWAYYAVAKDKEKSGAVPV